MISGWIRADKALHLETCQYLSDFLHKNSKDENAVLGDPQCTKSYGVYRHAILDQLLEEFTPKMEEMTGKKLFPTYSYARLYLNDEELLCHTDRESCEYSATINLGFGSHNWPIWIADEGDETDAGIVGDNGIYRIKNAEKYILNVGDALIYKGQLPHWRERFEGNWQSQVFLHYVDQDGPYKEYKYDKNESLAHHEVKADVVDDQCLYWFVPNAIADIACDQMSEKFDALNSDKATVGNAAGAVELPVRDVNKVVISNDVGIGATLTGIGLNVNNKAWQFHLTNSNQAEYLRYEHDGHYVSHMDTFVTPNHPQTRKLTVLAFLNDDFEGGRFYLQVGNERIYPEQEKGTVIVFPSMFLHGVEPVTKGVRRSIVTWLVGPWFK
jgi:hypothetical protein